MTPPRSPTPNVAPIDRALDRKRQELGIRTSFPDDVLRAAAEAARRDPSTALGRVNRTDLPFVTVDPPGSRDLDQALCLASRGDGFRLWYAIADVGFWVDRGGPIEREARLRGTTMYAPDHRDPLYPPSLGEAAASLLPGAVKPTVLFTFELDAQANLLSHTVERALVQSRAQLTYQQLLEHVETGGQSFADQPWAASLLLLKPFAERRREREAERGGVSLPIQTQHVERAAGRQLGYELQYEQPSPSEEWNAQVSLLTGHAAALRMIQAKVGLLRVLPPSLESSIARFRQVAQTLGFNWPSQTSYADFMRSLDLTHPHAATLVWQAKRVMNGADYLAFDGEVPADPLHHALELEYAHCTAPLRRLADRYVLDLLVTLEAGTPPSLEERALFPELAPLMNAAEVRGRRLENAVVDIAEAWTLKDRVGQTFPATVLGIAGDRVEVQIESPPVRAHAVRGSQDRWLAIGESVPVRLTAVSVEEGKTTFELAPP